MQTAVFTITRNEKYFLPVWYRYYSQFFDHKDIYILDHETTDGSTDNLPCNIELICNNSRTYDFHWLLKKVSQFQRKLLQDYNLVVFSETDEIIVPKEPGNFKAHINPNTGCGQCTGYEIIHRKDIEPALDWKSLPLLAQRNWYMLNPKFNKVLLGTRPIKWPIGFHPGPSGENRADPNLVMLHLRRIDYGSAMEKYARRDKKRAAGVRKRNYAKSYWWTTGSGVDGKFRKLDERFKSIV